MASTPHFAPLNAEPFEYEGRMIYRLTIDVTHEELHDWAMDLFEAYENYANGPGWEGLIQFYVEEVAPDLATDLDSDSEGDACLFEVSSEENLRKLHQLVWELMTDREKLAHYLETLPEEFRDA